MKYIGNKYKLLPFINEVVSKTAKESKVFCDIFAGTTSVSQYYKKKGYKIISNDFMTYSYILQMAYIKNNVVPSFQGLKANNEIWKYKNIQKELFNSKYFSLIHVVDYLNHLQGVEGFIYLNYTNQGTAGKEHQRQYYTEYNGLIIDAVRQQIENWNVEGIINEFEYYILLASLIDEADYLANISGTYGAFLKIWRSVATNKFRMKVPELIEGNIEHEVFQEDANLLIKRIQSDILYIDPPYNTRQYASNFHIPETIACFDNPLIYGKTGLRPYKGKASRYCAKSEAADALNDLIKESRTKYIYMSYNNEGIIKMGDIRKIFESKGRYQRFEKQYRRFRTERDHEKRQYKKCDDKTTEFIHFCEVKS